MPTKYVDKDNPSALNNVANGSAELPYLTPEYALTQAAASDTILVAPTATPYDLGATNLNVTKAITFQKWDGVRDGKPEINGGDATRLVNNNTANAVVFDGFVLRATNAGISNYVVQNRAACRNVRFRNCDFRGSVDLGAVNGESGSSGVIIEDTCTIDMDLGGAVYTGVTGAIECYADVIIRGVAQAVHFISNGDSNGTPFVFGGTIDLFNVNNYVVRCGTTNSDAVITVDSTFYLRTVPSSYSRTTCDIIDPRTFTIEDGARIDTTPSELGVLGDVWVRSPSGVLGTSYIRGLEIDRGAIGGYGVKIGDESPGASHVANSFTAIEIENVHIRDGGVFGTPGTTQTHMIFIGNEKKYKIKNCFIEGGAYGVGIKGDDTADPSSYTYNCKIVGVRLSSMKTKGVENTRWFNNLIIEDNAGGIGLDITDNTDSGASGIGAGTIARGNIYVMDTEVAINIDAASNLGNNDLDYNSFYIPTGVNIATIAGVAIETLEELQAARAIENHSFVRLDETPLLDADDLAVVGEREYQTGWPLTGAYRLYDDTGLVELVLSGGNEQLVRTTPFMRNVPTFYE